MENPFQRTEENSEDLEADPIVVSRITKDIFTSCDPENSGFVLVSHLINYIKPFVQGHKEALKQLYTALDSEGKDPLIDIDKFHQAMSVWANQISHEDDDGNDFHDTTPLDLGRLDSSDIPFAHSTPRSSFGQHLLKSYLESGILNASNTSTYSYTPNNATGCTDKVFYEDQIHELEFKNKKLIEELTHVRQELGNCVDQNETLQGDLVRVSKRLANQEKAYEELVKEKKCEEDCQEALNQAQTQIVKMEHELAACKKVNKASVIQLDDLKAENLNLQSKISHLNKMNDEFKSTISSLRARIELKEIEIASLQDINSSLEDKMKEHNDTLEQYNAKIDTLKAEKKLLSDRIIKSELYPTPTKPVPVKSSTPSEYSRLTRQVLRKSVTQPDLEVPFAPSIPADKFNFYNYEAPIARNRKPKSSETPPSQNSRLVDCSPLTATSTPKEVSIIDLSPPFYIKTIPILSPLKSDSSLEENIAKSQHPQTSPNGTSMYFTDEYEPENSQNSSLFNSSEEDICSRHLSLSPQGQYVSLHAEIAQATVNNVDHECDLNMKLVESENKIINLQFELTKHQNCEAIIEEKQKEIEGLLQQIQEDDKLLKALSAEVSDLKNEISLGQNRESVLHEKCYEFSEKLKKSKSFVTEVKIKLNEQCDLQDKFEELKALVDDLETENSLKYIRIVELTMENDRLQVETEENLEIKKVLATALRDKESLKQAKEELKDDLRRLTHEMATLEVRNQTLRSSLETIEKIKGEVESKKEKLQSELASLKESAQVEKRNILDKLSNLQSEMKKLEDENAKLSEQIEDLLCDRENKIKLIESANEKLIHAQSQMRFFEEKLLKTESVIKNDHLQEIAFLKSEHEMNQSEMKQLNDAKSKLEGKLKQAILDKKQVEEKLEELMVEKENWLTEKVREAKLGRKTGFDKLAVKTRKLEQKVEELEDQLLKEKAQNADALKKAFNEKDGLERENRTLYGEKLEARRKLIGALKMTTKLEKEKQNLTEEIQLLKSTQLTESETEIDAASKLEDSKRSNETLREARLNLSKSTLDMANSWSLFFGSNASLAEFWSTFAEGPPPCSDEVVLLKHQIDATTILLASFIATKLASGENQERNSQKNIQSSKPLKKFTLKPPTLIMRPVSPDSPSMDVLCRKFSAIGDANSFCSDGMGDNLPSPSGLCDSELSKPDVTEKDIYASNLVIPEQEASPNLNSDVLEDLGLLGDSVRFSEKETEEKFTAIVLAFTIDNASLPERARKQKDLLVSRENALAAKLAGLLDAMREYLTEEQLAKVSSKTEAILGICAQVSISAGQFGALRHEHHLVKTVAILINYAAILGKRLDTNRAQSLHTVLLQSNKSLKSSPNKTISNGVGGTVALKKNLPNGDHNSTSVSRNRCGHFKKLGVLLALIWTASFVYCTIFACNGGCSNPVGSGRGYPWSWLSWDEMFDHFVRKEYHNGPPPT